MSTGGYRLPPRKLTKQYVKRLMRCSRIDPRDVLDVCTQQEEMDPFAYFAKAVVTEREHGIAGASLGTDVVGISDEMAAKIVLAHLFGVEYGKDPRDFKRCPNYYHYLWKFEEIC